MTTKYVSGLLTIGIGADDIPVTDTRYDDIFAKYAGNLPVEFMRAVAWHESRLNPSQKASSGAVGLFQIVGIVLKDYNQRHNTKLTKKDMLDPELNTMVGAFVLNFIAEQYQKNHPCLTMDWTSPRYVALVVQGWNAGFSNSGGVGYIVGRMERAGIECDKITASNVQKMAAKLGLHPLNSAAKARYAVGVTRTFFGLSGVSINGEDDESPLDKPDTSISGSRLVTIAAFAALLIIPAWMISGSRGHRYA